MGVSHPAGKLYGWDAIIRMKTQELASYMLCRRTDLNFSEPEPVLDRTDSEAIRNQIVSMTATDARKCGIRKNTLWYLQRRAGTDKPFRIYGKVRRKLQDPMTWNFPFAGVADLPWLL